MGAVIGDAKEVEKLYEYGERLNEAKDKAQVSSSSVFSVHQFPFEFLGFWLRVYCLIAGVLASAFRMLDVACQRLRGDFKRCKKWQHKGQATSGAANSEVLQVFSGAGQASY
ncbi:hypothetical protein MA16_Dca008958 [Dendrobium catenatum]|uniref:Uncharacterized protein n=1 Tax=Dendrobium catenatum TaxID=906689 RepID=A0A2I0WRR0_9ASPA|nr:hypothetical protein MA16_Dca008958 [Dendrobium catenatum]